MVTPAVFLLGSYLLGSIPFGYLAGRLQGIDIRQAGSCNVGATNVVRLLGKRYGYPVFALDVLKGFAAVKISMLMATGRPPEWNSPEIFGILAAMSSVLGHLYPPWLKFKGGKGVATSAGALLALTPVSTLIGVAIWIIVFWLTRYVSLASITAAVVLPIVILVVSSPDQNKRKPLVCSSICVAAVVVWRHRSNLSRLIRGTEPRFTRKGDL
ncbi:MAG: acyl-phosphate glycerol 3-phosphate acyltransferase [Verrucomicrobia bacterium]|nr:MAG: acyl-phosphate glycerol 3-phosphate acyltransferase [Verrucomicrobiota bacterium]PYL12136.1 MAG: acyl-phosphate glycerol 3-phosphate acyltransferase [Verrucomicrobiota bacterium]